MEHKEEFRQFIKQFIEKHSPFKLKQMVTVNFYSVNRPYEVTKISVSEDGDIMYQITSPRSHETIPKIFKMSELQPYLEKEEKSQ